MAAGQLEDSAISSHYACNSWLQPGLLRPPVLSRLIRDAYVGLKRCWLRQFHMTSTFQTTAADADAALGTRMLLYNDMHVRLARHPRMRIVGLVKPPTALNFVYRFAAPHIHLDGISRYHAGPPADFRSTEDVCDAGAQSCIVRSQDGPWDLTDRTIGQHVLFAQKVIPCGICYLLPSAIHLDYWALFSNSLTAQACVLSLPPPAAGSVAGEYRGCCCDRCGNLHCRRPSRQSAQLRQRLLSHSLLPSLPWQAHQQAFSRPSVRLQVQHAWPGLLSLHDTSRNRCRAHCSTPFSAPRSVWTPRLESCCTLCRTVWLPSLEPAAARTQLQPRRTAPCSSCCCSRPAESFLRPLQASRPRQWVSRARAPASRQPGRSCSTESSLSPFSSRSLHSFPVLPDGLQRPALSAPESPSPATVYSLKELPRPRPRWLCSRSTSRIRSACLEFPAYF